ncbi:hypothetical protein BDR03DRAFT_447984 [Suillus americanus]|nr:hypothetical protein BDR03DRAFT_447984 [Suillus americanus]
MWACPRPSKGSHCLTWTFRFVVSTVLTRSVVDPSRLLQIGFNSCSQAELSHISYLLVTSETVAAEPISVGRIEIGLWLHWQLA